MTGGTPYLIQPNIRYCYREYWDPPASGQRARPLAGGTFYSNRNGEITMKNNHILWWFNFERSLKGLSLDGNADMLQYRMWEMPYLIRSCRRIPRIYFLTMATFRNLFLVSASTISFTGRFLQSDEPDIRYWCFGCWCCC